MSGRYRGGLRLSVSLVSLLVLLAACQAGVTAPIAPKTSGPITQQTSPFVLTPNPALIPTPGATPGPVAGVPGRIIYAREEGIWTLEPAVATVKKLHPSPTRVYFGAPALSPDGTLLAYSLYDLKSATEKRDNGTDLYMVNADGSNERLLLKHEEVSVWLSEPVWTPDGRAMYFTRRDAKGAERIERINPDGSGRTVLIENASAPTIAPDGQRLAYLINDPQTYVQSLWVADSSGANPRRLLGAPEFEGLASPRFSPNGQRLAFIGLGGPEQPDIKRTSLMPRRGSGWWHAAVAEAHGAPYTIWVVNVDGTGLRRLTNVLEVELPVLAWSPDDKWIAFTSDQGLNIVEVDGTQLRYLAREFAVGGLDWSAR